LSASILTQGNEKTHESDPVIDTTFEAARTRSGVTGEVQKHPCRYTSSLSQLEASRLRRFAHEVEQWGWTFSWQNHDQVELHTVPKICDVELRMDALLEFLTHLHSTPRQSSVEGDSVMARSPPTARRVLESKACHTAVRFGDFLSISERQSLLALLGQCTNPFQCAHGRPSIAVLFQPDVSSSLGDQYAWPTWAPPPVGDRDAESPW
jgi:DNA mismatch repair ATPase MutL